MRKNLTSQKLIVIMMIFTIFYTIIIPSTNVNAEVDVTPPVFNSISVDKKEVKAGDKVTITLDASDADTGIDPDGIYVWYASPITHKIKDIRNFQLVNGKYVSSFELGANDESGIWKIDRMFIKDKLNNVTVLWGNKTNLSGANFTLQGNQVDVTPPIPPTVNSITENSTIVSGIAEEGSLITVKVRVTVLGTAKTTSNGKYSVTIPKQKAETKLMVTATDNFLVPVTPRILLFHTMFHSNCLEIDRIKEVIY